MMDNETFLKNHPWAASRPFAERELLRRDLANAEDEATRLAAADAAQKHKEKEEHEAAIDAEVERARKLAWSTHRLQSGGISDQQFRARLNMPAKFFDVDAFLDIPETGWPPGDSVEQALRDRRITTTAPLGDTAFDRTIIGQIVNGARKSSP